MESRLPHEVNEEPSDESRNLVTIQQVELALLVGIVEDDAIGISIETAVPLTRHERDARRSLLLSLDVVCTGLEVECTGRGRVASNDGEGEDG